MDYQFEELNGLSEQEKELALKILQEYSKEETSNTYQQMIMADYKEIPVDIITFIKDRKYLGNAWHLSSGKCKLFPAWEQKLLDVFPDNISTNFNHLILSGARGLGKSEIAVTCGIYMLYRVMCLKNPHDYFNLKPTEKIAFAFMNITEALAYDIGVSKFQSTVQSSPWFMDRGTITGKNDLIWNPPDYIDIIVGSQPRHVIGQAVLFGFFDEISFIANQDIEKQKQKALDMIDTAIGGMKTRFTNNGKNPGLIVLASSKRSEKSFLETHMKKKAQTDGDNTYIVDEPVWNIRPASEYSGKKFYVAQGNKFLVSEVIPDNTEDIQSWRNRGYKILEVPVEYKANFLEDIDRALCDYAGVSSSDITKYISAARLQSVKHENVLNPFIKDVIEVGNAPNDLVQYYDFFDLSKMDNALKYKPLYIHLDMSLTGDKTGIAGVWIIGKKPHQEGVPDSKEMYFQAAFSVSIKAPKGYQVSFEKNRQFIYWLKEQGFNIKGVSSDTFQSADLAQQLTAKKYNYSIISVDRVKDGVCQPYQYFKNTIYEERIKLYDSELLTEEILGLERNSAGKIDHPDGGRVGCFTGDTLVSLTDGRKLSFVQLIEEFNAGKVNYVYSFNHNKNIIEPKQVVDAHLTIRNAKLLEITLDNGEKIKCTPNHRFMLRDGSYCEAKNLQCNQSLMPLYTKYPSKGLVNYRMYYEPMENKWHYEHRRFCNQTYDERYLVHHIDCNKNNNNPNNLIWCSKAAHQRIHSKLQTEAQSKSANKKRSASLSKYYENNRNNPVFIKRNNKISETLKLKTSPAEREARERQTGLKQFLKIIKKELSHRRKIERENHIKEIEDTFNVKYDELSISEKNSYGVKLSRLKNPDIQHKISAKVSENHAKGLYNNAYAATSKLRWYTNGEHNIYINPETQKIPKGFYKGRTAPTKNHKVLSVKYLDYTEDVYDLTIQDNHNFALSSGVFVHNSKDSCDALCGALWNASQNGQEYAFEFGEDINTTINVSKSNTDEYKKQLTVDFEQELIKAFDIMQNDNAKVNNKQNENNFMDFGMGKAQVINPYYLMNGIVI